jgi:hypothetical protein
MKEKFTISGKNFAQCADRGAYNALKTRLCSDIRTTVVQASDRQP